MNNQKKETIKTKDYIMLGIFSLLFGVTLFVIAGVLGIVPIGFPLFGLVGGIPCGIIFMYIVTKINKKGTIAILGSITALLYFLIGAYGLIPLFVFVGGLIAEIIISSGKYESFPKITLGYTFFMVSIWFGFMYPFIFEAQKYVESAGSNYSADYLEQMMTYATTPLFFVFLAATIIGAVIGSLLGKKMFKKHFAKIGA